MTEPEAYGRLHWWAAFTAGGLVGAAHLGSRAHDLYVAPRGGTGLALTCVVLAAAAAAILALRLPPWAERRLPWLLLATASAAATLAFVAFASFAGRFAVAGVCAALAALAALATLASVELHRAVFRPALALGVVPFLQHPFRLLALAAFALAAAAAAARVGVLRTGVGVATWLALAAVAYEDVHAVLEQRRLPARRMVRGAALCVFSGLVPGLAAAERLTPMRELSGQPEEIVAAVDGAAHRYVVTAAPAGYELFADGQLRLSPHDAERRARALVGPAVAVATAPARALLLHGGLGSMEREILKTRGVASLTVVSDDPALGPLAAAVVGGSATDRRTTVVHAEPAAWLSDHADTFDLVVDDLPAPLGYREGKYYTRHYLALLAAHLSERGVVVFPATSALATREAFSSVLATAASAGLDVAATHAGLLTLGMTSALVGVRHDSGTRLHAVGSGEPLPGFHGDRGADLSPVPGAPVATLQDPHVLEATLSAPPGTRPPSAPAAPSASAAPAEPRPAPAPSASVPAPPPTAAPSGASPAAAASPPAPGDATTGGGAPRRAYVVAAIGDSLTDPRSHGGRYLRYLAERCPGSRFDSYGKGGEMVNQMRRRFRADVLGIPPTEGKPRYDTVIVFGGVNDLYSDLTAHRTVKKITSDLDEMYVAARGHGLRVVAITVSPWGGFERYYNASRGAATLEVNRWILDQRAKGRVDAAVDAYSLLSCGDPTRLCDAFVAPFKDGLHFGKEAHAKLAGALHAAAFADCR